MTYVSQTCQTRETIIEWIQQQPKKPNRKTVKKAFPDVSLKTIRAAMAAAESRSL